MLAAQNLRRLRLRNAAKRVWDRVCLRVIDGVGGGLGGSSLGAASCAGSAVGGARVESVVAAQRFALDAVVDDGGVLFDS